MQNHDTGKLMKQLYACMCKDSQNATDGLVCYEDQVFNLATNNIKAFREKVYPSRCQAPPYIFKWSYQLESLAKRFRFDNDAFTDEELEQKLFSSFNGTQLRIPSGIPGSIKVRTVLGTARTLLKGILGQYDHEECLSFGRFGKNAAVGIKKKEGYPDLRLSKPISGSREHLRLFTTVLESDPLLNETIKACQKNDTVLTNACSSLQLSCVPKSFKARRGIMPNTEAGNFLSSCVGKYLESKLYMCGLPLSKVAERHKRWVKRYSVDRTHVTADLSAASDSFTSALVNSLVPRDWFRALQLGRITDYTWKGSQYKMNSFMTMGIGFTFPLQTLLFYALIKSIGKLLGVRGNYSVFGDDLIYPRRIHKYVKRIFEELGFILNLDKTFVNDYFRESCGSDSYRGVDVRPFQPEGDASTVQTGTYLMFLYKIVNGLRLRWNEVEIPLTLSMLKDEILATGFKVHQVPPSFPDASGWKTLQPIKGTDWEPVYVKYSPSLGQKLTRRLKLHRNIGFQTANEDNHYFVFNYWQNVAQTVPVLSQFPFYWDILRQIRNRLFTDTSNVSPLLWRTVKIVRKKKGLVTTRKRLRPFVTSKDQFQQQLCSNHTAVWL